MSNIYVHYCLFTHAQCKLLANNTFENLLKLFSLQYTFEKCLSDFLDDITHSWSIIYSYIIKLEFGLGLKFQRLLFL